LLSDHQRLVSIIKLWLGCLTGTAVTAYNFEFALKVYLLLAEPINADSLLTRGEVSWFEQPGKWLIKTIT